MSIEQGNGKNPIESLRFSEQGLIPYAGHAVLVQELVELGETELPHYLLTKDAYAEYADQQGVRRAVATKVWNGALGTIDHMHYHSQRVLGKKTEHARTRDESEQTIDLLEMLDALRHVEAGEIQTGYSFGQVGWDLFADLINTNLAGDKPGVLVLPFDSTIHPKLFVTPDTGYNKKTIADAAERLEQKYQVADYEAAKLRRQIALF